jgi:hypothetical protein
MFSMLNSLAKAAVATVVLPVAAVVDVVTLPVTADDLNRGPFDNTTETGSAIMQNLKDAFDPNK